MLHDVSRGERIEEANFDVQEALRPFCESDSRRISKLTSLHDTMS